MNITRDLGTYPISVNPLLLLLLMSLSLSLLLLILLSLLLLLSLSLSLLLALLRLLSTLPLPLPPLHRHRSTLIAPPPLPSRKPHANAVAVIYVLPVVVVLPSLSQPLCHHFRHRVAVATKQILRHRRCSCCRHRRAYCRRFTVAIPLASRLCHQLQAKPPPLMLPSFCRCCSTAIHGNRDPKNGLY